MDFKTLATSATKIAISSHFTEKFPNILKKFAGFFSFWWCAKCDMLLCPFS